MEDFVTFEIAKKLKEKGFKEECLAYYTTEYTLYNNVITLTDDKYLCVSDIDYEEFLVSHNSIKYTNGNYVDAPTISQALKWLRKEKKIHIEIFLYCRKYGYLVNHTQIYEDDLFHKCLNEDTANEEYASYEQAVLAGIEYVLDNVI
jgi:hypothetical protein